MRRPVNLRRTVCAASAPLLLSLLVHGLLLLVLWIWPTPSRSAGGVVSSTRISLETCVLDIGSPTLQPARSLPPDLRGPDVGTTMESRLLDPPPAVPETTTPTGPTVPAGDPVRPAANGSNPSAAGGPAGDGHGAGGLFPLPATAGSVVYVLDRSMSMGIGDKLDLACRELLASLRRLPPSARFQIICYSSFAAPLAINNRIGLLSAEPANIQAAARVLQTITASGNSNHADALRRGLALSPDVIYLITDADNLPDEEIEAATRGNSVTAIHIVELTHRRAARTDGPLARLARVNGGTYRRVPVGD
ncbi:MAG TPA: hypothetical protein VH643_28780 [Gemmataceae bacterium]|jgi:hypothetical protein